MKGGGERKEGAWEAGILPLNYARTCFLFRDWRLFSSANLPLLSCTPIPVSVGHHSRQS
jgi:hypothetical protein